MPRLLRNEKDDLWDLIRPTLKGKWSRLEAVTPAGVPDVFGLWNNTTWWLEMKIGRPSINALRSSQIDFACDCLRHGVPFWTVFGHQGQALYFRGITFTDQETPPFVVEPRLPASRPDSQSRPPARTLPIPASPSSRPRR